MMSKANRVDLQWYLLQAAAQVLIIKYLQSSQLDEAGEKIVVNVSDGIAVDEPGCKVKYSKHLHNEDGKPTVKAGYVQ